MISAIVFHQPGIDFGTEKVEGFSPVVMRQVILANEELLSLYFGIGRYVSVNSREGTWGTNAVAQISGQLKKELPGLRGFSETSIKLMRQFYETWVTVLNRQPIGWRNRCPQIVSHG